MSDWENLLDGLPILRGQIPDFTSIDPDTTWTMGAIVSNKHLLSRQAAALNQALELHKQEQAMLEVIERRMINRATPIHTFPNEVLLAIFEEVVHETASPIPLLSVCHRWMKIIFGQTGSRLWSQIRIPSSPNSKKGGDMLQLIRRSYLWMQRSGSIPLRVMLNRRPPSSPGNTAVFHRLVESAVKQSAWLSVASHYFSFLFPLRADTIRHLEITSRDSSITTPLILSAKSLTSLTATVQDRFPQALLDSLPSTCPVLRHLSISVSPKGSRSAAFSLFTDFDGESLHSMVVGSYDVDLDQGQTVSIEKLLNATPLQNPFPRVQSMRLNCCSVNQVYFLLQQYLPSLQHLVLWDRVASLTKTIIMLTGLVVEPMPELPPVLFNLRGIRFIPDDLQSNDMEDYCSALDRLLSTLKLHYRPTCPDPNTSAGRSGSSLILSSFSRPFPYLKVVAEQGIVESQSPLGQMLQGHLDRIWYYEEWKISANDDAPTEVGADNPVA
ncbi:hypothetical protein DL93DRAFT_2229476 [Clavulina sp. PMI_390]|nr:hypothetical protein DL93DRAFT_2229476 [Clavulina sp. PMI_390]